MKYFWAKYQQEMGIVKDEPESIDNINTSEKLSCDTSEEIYSCAQPPVSSPIRKFGKNIRCNPDDITFGLIDLDDFGIDSNLNETLSEFVTSTQNTPEQQNMVDLDHKSSIRAISPISSLNETLPYLDLEIDVKSTSDYLEETPKKEKVKKCRVKPKRDLLREILAKRALFETPKKIDRSKSYHVLVLKKSPPQNDWISAIFGKKKPLN